MAGLEYARKQGAGGTEGMIQTFAVDATHSTLLAKGDAVVITGDGSSTGVSQVDTGNSATANTGAIVAVAVQIEGENLTETGLPALTAGNVFVQLDPQALYEIESDATLLAADVGLNIGINVVTATKTGGLTFSNMTADSSSAAVTQTLPYRIVALLEGIDSGVLGDRVLVRPNASTQADGALGIA
jgi:hypothetical protein